MAEFRKVELQLLKASVYPRINKVFKKCYLAFYFMPYVLGIKFSTIAIANAQYFKTAIISVSSVTSYSSVLHSSGLSSHLLNSVPIVRHCFFSTGQPSAEQLLCLQEKPRGDHGPHCSHGPMSTSVKKCDILNKTLW